jgi:hypothetical protein
MTKTFTTKFYHGIGVIKKKIPSQAQWYCLFWKVCSMHIDNTSTILKEIKHPQHTFELRWWNLEFKWEMKFDGSTWVRSRCKDLMRIWCWSTMIQDPFLKFNNYCYDYIQTLGIGMLCIFSTIDVSTYVLI